MSKLTRREFVVTSTAAAAATKFAFGQAPALITRAAKPVVVASAKRQRIQERRNADCGRARIFVDDAGQRRARSHYLDPQKRSEIGHRVALQMVAEGLIDAQHLYGTINCDGVNAKGEVCGVTTTSGLAWKIPGRVGDSPIIGAGLYVDGDIGAAGSTGRGEANLHNLCSFAIVESMRRGAHPKDAAMDALKRIKANTIEKRLINSRELPNFYVNFYVLNAKGEYAGGGMYSAKYAVCTENGARTLDVDALLDGHPSD